MNKKNMIAIIITIVILIIIFLVIGIFMYNDSKKYEQKLVNISNEMVYNTSNMILIRDYDTFYTLEKILKDIVNDIANSDYQKILASINDESLRRSNEKQILMKLESFCKIIKESSYQNNEYSKLLYQVYQMEENTYDCLINIDGQIYYFLIYLDEEYSTVEIINFIFGEETE